MRPRSSSMATAPTVAWCTAVTVLAAYLSSALVTSIERQSQEPARVEFEVASVKRNVSGSDSGTFRVVGDTLVATNLTLQFYLVQAYGVAAGIGRFKFVDGPRRLLEARFDISAKLSDGGDPAQIPEMLRALLAERFRLRVRPVIRQTPVYALERVRDGQELRPSRHNCQLILATVRAEKKRLDEIAEPRDAKGRPACWSRSPNDRPPDGAWKVRSAGSIGNLIDDIQGFVDRPIRDATGLVGDFEWLLLFNPNTSVTDSQFPSVYTAIGEQLGLRLRAQSGPFEVLVIESLDWPTPN